jgi:hydroxymethylbilane synthase
MRKLTVGTRGSPLAIRQTEMTIAGLKAAVPDLEIESEIIHTKGDKILDVPLAKVGGKGLFVKEIEEALLDGRCDLAVHSLKDVPAELPEGLILGACLDREVPYDAFVSPGWRCPRNLPEGARVGTSSLRRQAQLKALRPDLVVVSLRGNVQTRLRKLDEGLDAVVLAAAGLRRLGLADRIAAFLTPPEFIPAAGQGIVVIECREDDAEVRDLLATALEHAPTRVVMRAERAFLAAMGGGCQVPLGALARIEGESLVMIGMMGRPDGSDLRRANREGPVGEPEALGRALAEALMVDGGRALLDELLAAEL